MVTNLKGTDRYLYDRVYCSLGDMENRLKDQQLDLFSGRASCHRFSSNQFRQLLSALAYTLIEGLRRLALGCTVQAKASPQLHPLDLAADRGGGRLWWPVVVRNTRRIRLLLSSTCPHQQLFRTVADRTDTS